MVDIVVPYDLVVVLFASDKFAILDLVTLVANIAIEGFDNCSEIKTLWYWFDAVLAFRRSVIVVCTLENEAEALRNEANLGGFSPAQQVKRDLAEAVILRHVVHSLPPPVESTVESLFGTGFARFFDRIKALESGILGLADGIIEVKLGSKVPFAIVCMATTDVVRMECEKGLIRGHSRGPRVKELHEEVEHVPHRVTLEAKLLGQVEKNIFDLSGEAGQRTREEGQGLVMDGRTLSREGSDALTSMPDRAP